MALKQVVKDILFQKILLGSLKSAAKEQDLVPLKNKIKNIVSDISEQYTSFKVAKDDLYLTEKVRNMHAFQMFILDKAISALGRKDVLMVDIGDSSGTHIEYAEKILKDKNINLNAFSVNLDPVAVEKIQKKGKQAILGRAELVHEILNQNVNIFCMFEVLEHFFDPISFLKSMSLKSKGDSFVITVPYVKNSRVGLNYIRYHLPIESRAENTHIFELSPEDWELVFKFTGWKVKYSQIYYQYPKYSLYRLTKFIWNKYDFEGFYGVILEKDNSYTDKYLDWSI